MSLLLLLRPSTVTGETIPGTTIGWQEPAIINYREPSILASREPPVIQGSDQ